MPQTDQNDRGDEQSRARRIIPKSHPGAREGRRRATKTEDETSIHHTTPPIAPAAAVFLATSPATVTACSASWVCSSAAFFSS